jgi:hypothetical protein
VYGVDPSGLDRVRQALPSKGSCEVRAESVFSFHGADVEPSAFISEYDPAVGDWMPTYTYAPELPLSFEPHMGLETRPGTMVTFAHTLKNTAAAERTFDLAYESELGWDYSVCLTTAPGVPVSSTGPIAPGASVDILLSGRVPYGTGGAVDAVLVTATAQDDPTVTASVLDRLSVLHAVYLPNVATRFETAQFP